VQFADLRIRQFLPVETLNTLQHCGPTLDTSATHTRHAPTRPDRITGAAATLSTQSLLQTPSDRWPLLSTVTREEEAASDHAAVVVDLVI
jgi:hypothetical protein